MAWLLAGSFQWNYPDQWYARPGLVVILELPTRRISGDSITTSCPARLRIRVYDNSIVAAASLFMLGLPSGSVDHMRPDFMSEIADTVTSPPPVA